jgi:predicted nicotinamide N-methyase
MEPASREFEFRGVPEPIVLLEDFTNDSANGTRTWEAGILLARYVEAACADKMRKKRVVELGPGTGIVSTYLGKLGCAEVHSLDYNALVVALLKRNVAENRVGKTVKVRRFDWGDPDDVAWLMQAGPWDWLLGADCVFSLAATALLVECLHAVASEHTVGLMSIETRDAAVTEAFVRGMEGHDFEIAPVSLRAVSKEYTHASMAIYRFVRKRKG